MKKIIISVAICIVVLILAIGILQWSSKNADTRMVNDVAANQTETLEITEKTNETSETIIVPAKETVTAYVQDDALVVGEKDAPVTLIEFSSLTCPHCATFHKNTLPALKKDYVETGKVKIIFRDFPLNKPALSASLLLKCVDVDKRYDFMDMLFEQQSAWAFDADYETKLQQYAALLGLSNEKSLSCMNDTETEEAMIQNMRAGAAQYGVNSTPSFIILPSNELIVGPQAYGVFSSKIETILAENE